MSYLCAVICTLLFLQSLAQPEWDSDGVTVDPGTDLVMRCSVDNTDADDVVTIEMIGPYPHSIYTATIALNEEIMPPFSNTGRYAVTRTYQDGMTTLDLSYTGIQAEDANILVCYVVSDDAYVSKARVNLRVKVPVELSLYFDGSDITEGGVISYMQGESAEWVRCIAEVDGSLEVPPVWMSLGGVNLTTGSGFGSGYSQSPLDIRQASKTLVYTPGFTLPYEQDGNTLVCRTEEVAVSATVEIKFSPRLACRRSVWSLLRVSEAFEYTCIVTSNPGDVELELVVVHGNSAGMVLLQEAQEAYVTKVTLKLESFQAVNVGRYEIRVKNSVGWDRIKLELRLDG